MGLCSAVFFLMGAMDMPHVNTENATGLDFKILPEFLVEITIGRNGVYRVQVPGIAGFFSACHVMGSLRSS